MPPNCFLIALALLATVLIQSCAGSSANGAKADCRGLSGSYRDAADPNGDSLTYFLLNKKSPQGHPVQPDVSGQVVRVSSGAAAGSLTAGKDFTCSGVGRIVLARQETSQIRMPPLIDQTKTVTYVLTGGAGADLVLSTYVQTAISPYGAQLKGPMQQESTIT